MPSRTKITFKDAFGKYMTADKFGVVGCEMEAAGITHFLKTKARLKPGN